MKSYCTSSSVLGFRYKNGVIVASDTSLNYGSLKMVRNLEKHYVLSNNTLLIMKGEYSDFQTLKKICDKEMEKDNSMGVKEWIRFLQRVLYYKRCNFKLLNISVIVAGLSDKNNEKCQVNSIEEFNNEWVIGVIDRIGNFYSDEALASGIGAHLALPYMRNRNTTEMSRDEAIKFMKENLQTLYYRDCMADSSVKILGVEKEGIWESGNIVLNGNWELGRISE